MRFIRNISRKHVFLPVVCCLAASPFIYHGYIKDYHSYGAAVYTDKVLVIDASPKTVAIVLMDSNIIQKREIIFEPDNNNRKYDEFEPISIKTHKPIKISDTNMFHDRNTGAVPGKTFIWIDSIQGATTSEHYDIRDIIINEFNELIPFIKKAMADNKITCKVLEYK